MVDMSRKPQEKSLVPFNRSTPRGNQRLVNTFSSKNQHISLQTVDENINIHQLEVLSLVLSHDSPYQPIQ